MVSCMEMRFMKGPLQSLPGDELEDYLILNVISSASLSHDGLKDASYV